MTTYSDEMTKALVAERQTTLHHEARQHRLGRLARGTRRRARNVVKLWLADLSSPPDPIPSVREYQLR